MSASPDARHRYLFYATVLFPIHFDHKIAPWLGITYSVRGAFVGMAILALCRPWYWWLPAYVGAKVVPLVPPLIVLYGTYLRENWSFNPCVFVGNMLALPICFFLLGYLPVGEELGVYGISRVLPRMRPHKSVAVFVCVCSFISQVRALPRGPPPPLSRRPPAHARRRRSSTMSAARINTTAAIMVNTIQGRNAREIPRGRFAVETDRVLKRHKMGCTRPCRDRCQDTVEHRIVRTLKRARRIADAQKLVRVTADHYRLAKELDAM